METDARRGERTNPGRNPTQKRSRERVEKILTVARELIERSGSDALKMSEIAANARISIGSLYQYFPDKAAILRTLAERYNESSRDCIREAFEDVTSADDLLDAFGELVETYYALFLAEPVMCDIWSGMQSDKALGELELKESRENGRLLAEAMSRVKQDKTADDLSTSAFLVMHLGEAAMRLAIALPSEEGRAVVDTYKAMALREIAALLK